MNDETIIQKLERVLLEAKVEIARLQYSPTLSVCEKGHRFHTTATHPARNEREWICPWCEIEQNKQLQIELKAAREEIEMLRDYIKKSCKSKI